MGRKASDTRNALYELRARHTNYCNTLLVNVVVELAPHKSNGNGHAEGHSKTQTVNDNRNNRKRTNNTDAHGANNGR